MTTGAEGSQTLDRALVLLGLLAGSDTGWTVTELAAEMGTARPVVYRLLTTLEGRRLATKGGDGRFRLGLGVLALAARVHPVLRDAATPVLRRLADDVGATAHLTLADGDDALAVAVVEPQWTAYHVAYRVGFRHSLSLGAAGRAILAARGGTGGRVEVSDGELQAGAHGVAVGWVGGGLEGSVGVVSLAPLEVQLVGRAVRAAARGLSARLRT